MSVQLVDLVTTLQIDIAPKNGVPSDSQYEMAVKSAVGAFSRRAGMVKQVTVSVVKGTVSYTLPDDFLNFIKVESLIDGSVYVQPGGGLIPMGSTISRERWTTAGLTLTIYPTPTYTADRVLWYKAGYVLNSGDVYLDMTEEIGEIALIKGRANLLRLMGSGVARDGWKYSIGDVAVDKSGQPRSYRDMAKDLDEDFDNRITQFIGPVGARATYSLSEQAAFNK